MTATSDGARAIDVPATRGYLRNRLLNALVLLVFWAGATVAGALLIDRYPDSASASVLFWTQLVLILAGPVGVATALFLLWLWTRRWVVMHRRVWIELPGRAGVVPIGPFRLTVIGITVTPGAEFVIFPGGHFRRVRDAVDRSGRVLVLRRRDGKPGALYAAGPGAPVFTNHPALSQHADQFWQRRGRAVLSAADADVR